MEGKMAKKTKKKTEERKRGDEKDAIKQEAWREKKLKKRKEREALERAERREKEGCKMTRASLKLNDKAGH